MSGESQEQFTPCEHQVGGWHNGTLSRVLKDKRGLILKPLKYNANPTYNAPRPNTRDTDNTKKRWDEDLIPVCRNELDFYVHLKASTSIDDVQLKSLIPSFFGSRQIHVNDEEVTHLVLQDLAAGMRLPCVADIKMGHSVYYPGKKNYSSKSKFATQEQFGFCLTGMQLYDPETGQVVKQLRPDACKKLTVAEISQALASYCLEDRGCTFIRQAIIQQLQEIHKWFSSQQSYIIRCSSILIVYDAAQINLHLPQPRNAHSATILASENDGDKKPCVTVKMIDFAHVFYSDGKEDNNYVSGLKNLAEYLSEMPSKNILLLNS